MSIIGVGTDIIEIDRVKKAADDHFMKKVFTDSEREFFSSRKMNHQSIAGAFAAKESVVKALGTGFSDGIAMRDIEIVHDEQGKPLVQLCGRALEIADGLSVSRIELSISHCKAYAVAFAVAVAK